MFSLYFKIQLNHRSFARSLAGSFHFDFLEPDRKKPIKCAFLIEKQIVMTFWVYCFCFSLPVLLFFIYFPLVILIFLGEKNKTLLVCMSQQQKKPFCSLSLYERKSIHKDVYAWHKKSKILSLFPVACAAFIRYNHLSIRSMSQSRKKKNLQQKFFIWLRWR